jgi:hypothetical protein
MFDVQEANDAFIKAYLKEGRFAEAVEFAVVVKLGEHQVDPVLMYELARRAAELKDYETLTKIEAVCDVKDYLERIAVLKEDLRVELGKSLADDFQFSDEYTPIDIKVFDLDLPKYTVIQTIPTDPDSEEVTSKEAASSEADKEDESGEEEFEGMERSSEESSESSSSDDSEAEV